MSNEMEKYREAALQEMVDQDISPIMPAVDLSIQGAEKFPLANLSMLGVAFQPLTSAIQTALTGSGGSGLYFANTYGKQMFSSTGGFIGSLQTAGGAVGGGQARMIPLGCDPTMLFMAAALMNVEKKLDDIRKAQEEILEFLEAKERASLQGNLNTLADVLSNFKYNWNSDTYKTNKHILVQDIKKDSEASIVLYRDQIAQQMQRRSRIHSDQEVHGILKKLGTRLQDYQLALYLYSYSSFLEVLLLGNFTQPYLESVEKRISDYALQYRELYTSCYNLLEEYSKSSIQAGVMSGLASAGKLLGKAVSKVPVISNSQLDENLLAAGDQLKKHGDRQAERTLKGLIQNKENVTLPFVENLHKINQLYNHPVAYLFDGEAIYIKQLES